MYLFIYTHISVCVCCQITSPRNRYSAAAPRALNASPSTPVKSP